MEGIEKSEMGAGYKRFGAGTAGMFLFIFFLAIGTSFPGELPTIVEISPPDGATGVPLDTEIIV